MSTFKVATIVTFIAVAATVALACPSTATSATLDVAPTSSEPTIDDLSSLWNRVSDHVGSWSLPTFAWSDWADHLVRAQVTLRNASLLAQSELIAMSRNIDPSSELRWAAIDLSVLTAEPVPGRQSSGFGWRSDPINHNAKFHRGSDVRAPHGTPIDAAGNGLVIFAGRQNGYGNVVYIDHGGGLVTRYGHMQKIVTSKGASVSAGQQIGMVGSTGRATGPHLHFEVRLDGRAVNPNAAMEVAELKRNGDDKATLAMMRLSPEIQESSQSMIDPPHRGGTGKTKIGKSKGTRPERHGRGKRVKSVS
jgi:hypothetical protein